MNTIINVSVKDRVASAEKSALYICGNSDYVIKFNFDDEWAFYGTKTARFRYRDVYQDQVFSGTECPVPVFYDISGFTVGVFAGNLRTTTEAHVSAKKSALCKGGVPDSPPDDIYAQIMEKLNNTIGVSREQIEVALKSYFEENPIDSSVSEEELLKAVEDALNEAKESGDFKGNPGDNGFSPTIDVEPISDGNKIKITDVNGTKTVDIMNGKSGSDGVSPTVTVSQVSGGNQVKITDANGTKTFTVKNGTTGPTGPSPRVTATSSGDTHTIIIRDPNTGYTMANITLTDGKDGRGIQSIDRTDGNGSAGTVDTYTITYTDGTTSTYQVRNGKNGSGGEGGEGGTGVDGEDGGYYTPSVDVNGNLSWSASKAGMPSVPSANIKGRDGTDGEDGTSVTHSWNGTTLTITSKSGTSSVDLKGEPGEPGYTPQKGVDYFDGAPGEPGEPGYTPQKGVDYFDGAPGEPGEDGKDYVLTDADKQEIAGIAAGMVEVHVGETEPTDPNVKVWINPDGEVTNPGGGSNIDDSTPSPTTTYSSKKIEEELTKQKEAIAAEKSAREEAVELLNEEIEALKNPEKGDYTAQGKVISFDSENGGETIKITGTLDFDGGGNVRLQHCGENLLDMTAHSALPANVTVEDGWYVVRHETAAEQHTSYDIDIPFSDGCPMFVPSEKYKVFIEVSDETTFTGGEPIIYPLTRGNTTNVPFYPIKNIFLNANRVGKIMLAVVESYSDFVNVAYAGLTRIEIPTNTVGIIKFRIAVVKAGYTDAINAAPAYNFAPDGTVYPVYQGSYVDQYVTNAMVGRTISFPDLVAYEGVNNIGVGHGTLQVTVEGLGSAEGNDSSDDVAFNPADYSLPILYLNGATSQMSKDVAVDLAYKFGERTGTASVKWQGSSSIAYPKKNYTIKFDNAFEAKDGWGVQKKYCLKANYIDHSHARNVVNAKLWGQIVKSRAAVPDELADLPNGGAIDGFPIIIVINGKFHGVYTLNIPKDGWMFGMGGGTTEAIICADQWVPATYYKAEALVDGSDFKLEYVTDEDNAAWVATSFNRLINACIASDGSDLDTTIAQYLDWDSAIDYLIFTVMIVGFDMTGKNYLNATFDGTKWFFSAYDMDCTYCLSSNGSTFYQANQSPSFAQYAGSHKAMELIVNYKKDALKARYTELRETVLSESNIATEFANFAGMIPSPVLMQEAKLWPGIPNTSVNNISQVRDAYRLRCMLADKWIEKL